MYKEKRNITLASVEYFVSLECEVVAPALPLLQCVGHLRRGAVEEESHRDASDDHTHGPEAEPGHVCGRRANRIYPKYIH